MWVRCGALDRNQFNVTFFVFWISSPVWFGCFFLSSLSDPPLPVTGLKETFICEVEVLRQELKECELLVEGQFASESQMEEWNYTPHFGLKTWTWSLITQAWKIVNYIENTYVHLFDNLRVWL